MTTTSEQPISNKRYNKYLDQQENKDCFYCKRQLNNRPLDDENEVLTRNPFLNPTRDHIIPRSKGGNSKNVNTKPCCHQCNKFKANLTPEEFLRFLEDRLSAGRLGSYPLSLFKVLIESTKALIIEIEPITDQLYRDGWNPLTLVIVEQEKAAKRPTAHIAAKSEKEWLDEFQKKHPFIYTKMVETMPDLVVWVYRNIVKNKEV